MNRFKIAIAFAATFVVAMLLIVPVMKAGNDAWNKRTTMVFTQPFEVPGGQTLPAGTYVFKLLDSPFDRDIVQVFSADQNTLYATILAIPDRRLEPGDKTIMLFQERATGQPQAIKAWFHPGERGGHEFVYPHQKAVEIAKVTNQPVPFLPNDYLPQVTEPTQKPAVTQLEQAPIKAVEPSGKEVEVAEAFLPLPQQPATLPKTASLMPLLALTGMFILAAGIAIRVLAKQED